MTQKTLFKIGTILFFVSLLLVIFSKSVQNNWFFSLPLYEITVGLFIPVTEGKLPKEGAQVLSHIITYAPFGAMLGVLIGTLGFSRKEKA